jgi:DHA1 family bicyclomycin/chloramphenicol resistance-like MFS transporter
MGFREFVVIMAALMATNAIAIDAMLPALPEIGRALQVAEENQVQLVITAYLLGFGFAQIFYGPLSDRFGRRPVLLTSLVAYTIFSLIAAFAVTLDQMVVARALQGAAAAACRVLSVSIVRDSYSGRRMARVMSLAFILFIAVPVVAPTLGQVVVLFAPWPWIFVVLALTGAALTLWTGLRLPETLPLNARRPISVASILDAFRIVLTNRMSVGYTIASTLVLGGLFGFINSAQQIFVDVLGLGVYFPLVFAIIALFVAASSLLNSRIVERVGMRIVSHTALLGFTAVATIHALVAAAGLESVYTFVPLQAAMMFCFGLTIGNFGAMAMEPVGHVAGTASSVQGFITTLGAALIGFWIGQQFNGTVLPLMLGFSVLGFMAIAAVLVTEHGRLFRPTAAPAG